MKTNRKPTLAQQAFNKPRALAECLVKDLILGCGADFPVIINFDVTGKGMCRLPQIFWEDMAEFVKAIPATEKPTIYFSGIGDIRYDYAPLQITGHAVFETEHLRQELAKLWLEQGGGGGEQIENLNESYEMMAYFLAKRFTLPRALHTACIFVADEAPRGELEKTELDYYLGGVNASTDATTVFAELKQKFHGNVFLIWRPSFGAKENNAILEQWRALIGDNKILTLPNDRLITVAVRELIIAVAANHSMADAQKKLNELAPTVCPRAAVVQTTSTTPKLPLQEVRPSNIPAEFQLATDADNKLDAKPEEPTLPIETLKDLGL
ncbi:hypothetical protein A2482_04070 [Candidatus Falkowbacteria bacterium RIFOXYC2_FULL_48_21]|uniref:Uncharacterized protein n=1 Tax=Candidatus Falkowbacteria bacterium RIFOXYC2_FULL_48_21 TaxID=1798005 RepID=A0A1F5T8Y5_9BACT|nr:MAG: hypothetical protein A2482_04070 [Candidatus Falkowbacteria bacterium RIFOXYC2_FULL_48_21]